MTPEGPWLLGVDFKVPLRGRRRGPYRGEDSTTGVAMNKLVTVVLALVVVGWAVGSGGDDPKGAGVGASSDSSSLPGLPNPGNGESEVAAGEGPSSVENDGAPAAKKRTPESPKAGPRLRTHLVTRVVDGDTLELGTGASVRIVGIDTPERGECGYDAATRALEQLVLGRQVRLTVSDEDQDRYGRLLRYVNVGQMDAGLKQIKSGWAIARYDSRDGYGYHPRENVYIATDKATPDKRCPKPVPVTAAPAGGCEPGYSPCVPPYPGDLDCADVNGPIKVTGSDPHRLDADGDGVACE